MPRRASDSNPDGKRPCAFCRTLRVVVVFALLVVALMAYADKLAWLENIQFTDIFAYFIAVAFIVVLLVKVWQEYWQPKKHAQGREERRDEMARLFDEMDEAVAKREAEAAVRTVVEDGDTLVTQVTRSDHHEESLDESGELHALDTHTVSLAVTVEHHQPSPTQARANANLAEVHSEAEEKVEEIEQAGPEVVQSSQSSQPSQPEQLDIFGYQIKDK